MKKATRKKKKSKLKIDLTFNHAGTDWTIHSMTNGYYSENDTVVVQDEIGRQMIWDSGGLEYYLQKYPTVIKD